MEIKRSKLEIKELQSKIINAFPKEVLAAIPESEQKDYLNLRIFPIELLIKADWNYKKEDKAMSEKLRANLERNGQIENIHVRLLKNGMYEVVNGNHRLDEMLALDRKTVIAFDHGKCTKEEAVRKCIETNETIFERDDVKLAKLITEITEVFELSSLIDTLPYTESEINDFNKLSNFSWDQYAQSENEEEEIETTSIIKIEYDKNEVGIIEDLQELLKKYPNSKII